MPTFLRSARAALALGCLVLAGCSGGPRHTAAAGGVVTAGTGSCLWGGPAPSPGSQEFTVRDADDQPVRITLADPTTGGIWAQSGTVAPGTSLTVRAVLPSGRFLWRCVPLAGTAAVSGVRHTSGTGDGARPGTPLRPLSAEEANQAVAEYRQSISTGMTQLGQDTDALAASVAAGDVGAARDRWLTAHLDYERLGAAYGTFGDVDNAVDGLPDGLPAGVDDAGFTGFLRVEHDLWSGGTSLSQDTQRLADDVHRLVSGFPGMTTPPADIPLRAHEILEMTLQRELSGRSDQGSHTALATARANLDGTLTVLATLTMPLRERDPGLLAEARAALNRLTTTLDGLRGPDGRWPALGDLTTDQRERLDAAVGAAVERLAPIPDALPMPPSTNVD